MKNKYNNGLFTIKSNNNLEELYLLQDKIDKYIESQCKKPFLEGYDFTELKELAQTEVELDFMYGKFKNKDEIGYNIMKSVYEALKYNSRDILVKYREADVNKKEIYIKAKAGNIAAMNIIKEYIGSYVRSKYEYINVLNDNYLDDIRFVNIEVEVEILRMDISEREDCKEHLKRYIDNVLKYRIK